MKITRHVRRVSREGRKSHKIDRDLSRTISTPRSALSVDELVSRLQRLLCEKELSGLTSFERDLTPGISSASGAPVDSLLGSYFSSRTKRTQADVVSMKRSPLATSLEGGIPVEFLLVDEEISTMTPPVRIYEMASYASYLPLVSVSAIEYLSKFVVSDSNMVWFAYGSEPIPWQHPIGVLYDLLSGKDDEPAKLPLSINVRFRNFPKKSILPLSHSLDAKGLMEDAVRRVFFNSLKQALKLRDLSVKRHQDMSVDEQNSLWNLVLRGGGVSDLLDSSQHKMLNDLYDPSTAKRMPIRVFRTSEQDAASKATTTIASRRFEQKPVVYDPRASLFDVLVDMGVMSEGDAVGATVQGVRFERNELGEVDCETVVSKLSYLDGFVYVVVHDS